MKHAEPFWQATTMRGESLFFIRRDEERRPSARLLFRPTSSVSLRSATGETTYDQGRDYVVDAESGTISLPEGSRIPFKTLADLYPPADSDLPRIAWKKGDPRTHLLWAEDDFFHRLQVEATYTHAPGEWRGYVPTFAGGALPRTMRKLTAGETLTVCLSGDSISAGYNASECVNAPPWRPPYGEQVAAGLEAAYGARVRLCNFAVGGWRVTKGIADAPRAIAERPDLVLIAYGANDAGAKDPAAYGANVRTLMARVRKGVPEAEFILVASMLGNDEWAPMDVATLLCQRDELAALCGAGVALADLAAVWEEMLQRKSFHDLTGNGVNHPNDFGHRLYAEVILALLAPAAG